MTATSEKIRGSAWATLAILSSLALITMYGETMVLPAIPNFIHDFDISYSTSSWILSSYLIAGAVMTPIAGKLSDSYGKKKVLLVVMAVYAAGILGGGFANNITFMLAARVTQGIGISMFPIAFGIIRDVFPERKLAIAQSIFTSTFSGGAVIGLLAGASIIQNYGWHATFFSILPVAIFLAWIIVRFIKVKSDSIKVMESGKTSPSIDLKGALALATTVISFLAGLSFLENSVGSIGIVAGLFITAVVSLAAFVAIEKRTVSPLIDLKLITHRIFLQATIILMIVGLATFMVYQTIPIMIQSPKPLGYGGDALVTASVQLPFMVISLVVTIASGFIVNRIGNARLAAIGTVVSTLGFFGLFMFHSSEFMIASTLAVISVGLSLALIGGFNMVLISVPREASGIAIGMTVLLMLVGQSVGPSIAGMYEQLYQGTVVGKIGHFPSADAYNLIFLTAALITLVSVALAMALNRRKIIATIDVADPTSEKID